MRLIDTHCYLTFKPLNADVGALLERSTAAGVTSWITVGTSLEDSQEAVELADRRDNLYATVGVHPHDAKDVTSDTLAQLEQLAQNVKVVAVGETGLDVHYNFSKQPDQLRVFAAQLKLARELNLPVVVHSRNAFDRSSTAASTSPSPAWSHSNLIGLSKVSIAETAIFTFLTASLPALPIFGILPRNVLKLKDYEIFKERGRLGVELMFRTICIVERAF